VIPDPVHRAAVEQLTDGLAPVRRLWSPWVRLALWIALALGTVAFAAAVGLRHDLRPQLDRPPYLLTLAVLLAGAGLAATLALLGAVPGRIRSRRARGIATGLLLLAITAALLGESGATPSTRVFVTTGLRCLVCVGAFGLLPWMTLFWAVARAAPLDGPTSGLCIGAAAFLVGAAAVRVACPLDDPLHLALWHGMPVALWATGSMVAGGACLARWLPE
jgi:hypothetical protein